MLTQVSIPSEWKPFKQGDGIFLLQRFLSCCSYGPKQALLDVKAKASLNNLCYRQSKMFNLNSKCSAQFCGLWAQLSITKDTAPARSRPRALGEWWKSSKQTQLVLQIAVKWLKTVNLPQKLHLPNICCFVGQKAATVHTAMMLPCLLNASSSKLHFTSAALEKAPLTNQAHL